MNPYLEITRAHNCLMAGIAVFAGAMVASEGMFVIGVLSGFLSAFIIAAAGFIINDYYDIDVDRVNRPKRPLPSGKISLSKAYRYAMLLFGLGILISVFINLAASAIALFNSILLYLYAWRIKRRGGLEKNLTVSYLVSSPFLFGGAAVGNIEVTLFLVLLAGLANTSREILKDIEDFEGDMLFSSTLPMKVGFNKSARIAGGFMMAAIIFSPMPYLFGILGKDYLILVSIANVSFLASFVFLRKVNVQNAKKTQKFIKLGMFLALVAFIAGIR